MSSPGLLSALALALAFPLKAPAPVASIVVVLPASVPVVLTLAVPRARRNRKAASPARVVERRCGRPDSSASSVARARVAWAVASTSGVPPVLRPRPRWGLGCSNGLLRARGRNRTLIGDGQGLAGLALRRTAGAWPRLTLGSSPCRTARPASSAVPIVALQAPPALRPPICLVHEPD